MIKKRLTLLFVLCLFLGAHLIAQEIKWAVHANIGNSQILFLDLDRRSNLFEEINLKNKSKTTWNYGATLAIPLDQNIQIETGLSVLSIKGKFTYDQEIDIGPRRKFKVRNIAETFYLGIPVNMNFQFKDLIFSSGLKTLIFIQGDYSNYKPEGTDLDGNPLYLEENESLDFRRFDLGLALGLKYKINKLISLNTDCYWGMSNMFANPSPSGNGFSRRNRFFTLGFSYYIQD